MFLSYLTKKDLKTKHQYINIEMFFLPTPPNKISDETLDLFKKVLENDLRVYGQQLAKERGLDEKVVFDLIPGILATPISDKINNEYLDTKQFKYSKELNRYNCTDLKEICRRNDLKGTGTRDELIQRISAHLGLAEHSNEDLEKSKSFKSKPLKSRKKVRGNVSGLSIDATPNHYVSDSD